MGYSGWVFNRIDTRLKDLWHSETHLQFMWKPEGSPAEPLFSHVLDTHYGAPELTYNGKDYHFDFEVFGGLGGGSDPSSQIPVSSRDPSVFYNHTSDEMAEAFVALARLRAGTSNYPSTAIVVHRSVGYCSSDPLHTLAPSATRVLTPPTL